MSDIAIHVENIGKRYRIGERQRYKALRDTISNALYAPVRAAASLFNGGNSHQADGNDGTDNNFWSLKDVSFDIKQGEAVGVIGRNGAGKSTLLKILSRITKPTEGYARIHGRVGSLLEVGTGFHPELTGRENTYLNGAIIGMRKQEIERKFDEIVAFAEIEKFIDTPVKFYSSGMYIRLAFAVAAHLEPEILLVDEVLAVGDAAFQKKCMGKMGDVAKEGRTVLFVSHNTAAIENLCEKVILLDRGALIRHGETREVMSHYLDTVISPSIEGLPLVDRKDRTGNGSIRLTSFHIEDLDGHRLASVMSGADIVFVLGFRCREGETPGNVDVGLAVGPSESQPLFRLYRSYSASVFTKVPSYGEFRCHIQNLPLSAGCFTVSACVKVGRDEADWPRDGVGHLNVENGDFYGSGKAGDKDTPFLVQGAWEFNETDRI